MFPVAYSDMSEEDLIMHQVLIKSEIEAIKPDVSFILLDQLSLIEAVLYPERIY